MSNLKALTMVRKAIFKVLGSYIDSDPKRAKEIIERATYTGESDPGEWAPKALVVVHCETGIPSSLSYGTEIIEKWFEIDDMLRQQGMEIFSEPINGGVTAFYK